MPLASDNNLESPSNYGKEAYKKYRKKEKQRSKTLGPHYKQKRTKIVSDTYYVTVLAHLLKDLKFPASKEKIIQYIIGDESSSVSGVQSVDILSIVQGVQEKDYKTVSELAKAVELVHDI
jgi:hypothetical protein